MDPWWMYALVFIFGYMTCRTFYFVKASRISLRVLIYSQIIYISIMLEIIEKLQKTKSFSNEIKRSVKEMASVCDEINEKIDEEMSILKNNSIKYLINMHPKFYRDSLKFEDWDSSMRFLKDKKQEAFNFWNHNGN